MFIVANALYSPRKYAFLQTSDVRPQAAVAHLIRNSNIVQI
jgi:hypothetical protein